MVMLSNEKERNPSVTGGDSSNEGNGRNPSVTCGDSSPTRGAFSGKPPFKGEVARSAGGVSSRRRGIFTIEDVRKRGLIWDGHSLPYNPNLVENARVLRKNMTKAEKKLWYEFLRAHEKKFYRQRPIDHFIADFYCSDCGLIIELDGSQHYTPDGLKRDAVRADILSLYGLDILRFTNADVLKQFDAVCKEIDMKLQGDPSVTCGDSSPITGAEFGTPPHKGEVARSAEGVSSCPSVLPVCGGGVNHLARNRERLGK